MLLGQTTRVSVLACGVGENCSSQQKRRGACMRPGLERRGNTCDTRPRASGEVEPCGSAECLREPNQTTSKSAALRRAWERWIPESRR